MSLIAEIDNQAPLRADHKATARFEEITPELARLYLERNITNREMRAAAIDAYARDLAADAWKLTGEAIKFDWNGQLVDGQHRLSAIVKSGHPAHMLIVEGLDPAVQRVLDVNVRRSAGDMLRLLGIHTNVFEMASMARLAITRASGQLNTYGTAHYTVSHQEIYTWVQEHPEAVDSLTWARRLHGRFGAAASPLSYCIWELAQIDAKDVEIFFESVANYATDGRGDPRQALLRALQAHRETLIGRRPGTQIGLIFSAWNAWRDKQQISALNIVDSKGQPLKIPDPI